MFHRPQETIRRLRVQRPAQEKGFTGEQRLDFVGFSSQQLGQIAPGIPWRTVIAYLAFKNQVVAGFQSRSPSLHFFLIL
ncbi:MAG TPA: hypothetical protein PL166_03290 [Candidatus Contendobacter sp.]|nr:hypothetical protein [Candidatus Contendobacter sp.]HRD48615.1 hypothetical protein [Candidatus Contendobacter sp.]